MRWTMLFRVVGLCGLALVVLSATGCVSVETAKKMDSLEARIQKVAEDHAAGKLTTKEAQAQFAPLLEEMKAVRDADDSWLDKLFYGVMMLAPWVLRAFGVPLFRSGSGKNIFKSLASK